MLFRTRPNRAELESTKVPTARDIAWAAGIYEGEGNARLCGRGKRSLAVSVGQKDPEILYRLRDWFGGSVNNPSAGNPCFKWDICGDRARIFLAQIFEYLSARRKVQVAHTDALQFMCGESPVNQSVQALQSRLLVFYEQHNATTWRGSRKNEVRRAHYRAKKNQIEKVVAIA